MGVFFISGILITQSFNHSNSAKRFVLIRIARIYSGGLACFFATSLLLGPIVSSLAMSEYFGSWGLYCYMRNNWSLTPLLQWTPACNALPGVFERNRFAQAVNGSLWTMTPELVCYTYVLAFGLLGTLKTRHRILLTIAVVLAVHAALPTWLPYFSDVQYSDKLKVGLFFLAGVTAYAFRDAHARRWRYAAIFVARAVILDTTPAQEYALYAVLF